MKPLIDFIQAGGPVMLAILALSIVLYSRCFKMLLQLRRSRRQLAAVPGWRAAQLPLLRRLRLDVQGSFRQQRIAAFFKGATTFFQPADRATQFLTLAGQVPFGNLDRPRRHTVAPGDRQRETAANRPIDQPERWRPGRWLVQNES